MTAKYSRAGRSKNDWVEISFAELDAWREAYRITKSRCAQLLGVSSSTYHNWKRGECAPNLATQRRARAMLDRDPLPAPGSLREFACPPVTGDRSARRFNALAQALGSRIGGGGSGSSADSAPSSAAPGPHLEPDRSSSRLETQPKIAPGRDMTSTLVRPSSYMASVILKDYLPPGADPMLSFQPATGGEIISAIARLASAASVANKKMTPEEVVRLVRLLRGALT